MARIKIEPLSKVLFTLNLPVRITDINYGNHLGHDSLISMLHEVRAHFFKKLSYTELNVEGVGIIIANLAVEYKREAFFGDELHIAIGVGEVSKKSMEFLYQVTNAHSSLEVARATINVAFFDYTARKIVRIPEVFLKKIQIFESV